jgi:hypothetical protein
MKKITVIFLKQFRNDAHYEFMAFFKDLMISFDFVQFLTAEWCDIFMDQFNKEEKLVDLVRKSIFTQQIVEADKRVDNGVTGLKSAINAYLYGYDPNKKLMAQILMNRLKIVGNITEKSYEDEAGGIRKLILDFEGEYAGQIETLGLAAWVMEIKVAELEFKQLMKLRDAERSKLLDENLKDVRENIDISYLKIIDIVNSAATIDKSGKYDEFIKQLNTQVIYFNEHAAHRKSKKDIADTVAETVPPQKYTGKPIIIIPNLTDADGNDLVFTVNFSVRFKNNTEVGNAKIIITGIRNYKGKKEIGFDIIN